MLHKGQEVFTAYIKKVFDGIGGGNVKAKDANMDGSNLIGS
jgi:hypothetical protein